MNKQEVVTRAARIRLVAMDVDGVLTDGGVFYSEEGEALKRFHMRDGMGIVKLHEAGLLTAIVTTESTAFSTRRAEKLQIAEVHTGITQKLDVLKDMCQRHQLSLTEVCFIGDDINDLEALKAVGFACSVADGSEGPRQASHYVTTAKGGQGAVREVCDLILRAKADNPG